MAPRTKQSPKPGWRKYLQYILIIKTVIFIESEILLEISEKRNPPKKWVKATHRSGQIKGKSSTSQVMKEITIKINDLL